MTTYTIPESVLTQEVAGELVLLDLNGEGYFSLNDVGNRTWQMLQKGMSQPEIVNQLLSEFDVAKEQLDSDIGSLLDQLQSAGLIVPLA